MLKFTERPKTLGMTSKKNIAFPEGNKLFAGNIALIRMKQTLTWFHLQRCGTRNGFSNMKETSGPVYEHFPVFNTGLSSSYDGCGQNVKKKCT